MAIRLTRSERVDQWRESLQERIDNLNAVYQCDKIKHVVNIALTADSVSMLLMHVLFENTDGISEETFDRLHDITTEAIGAILANAIGLLGTSDDRADDLLGDILRIVQTKYELEDILNGEQ